MARQLKAIGFRENLLLSKAACAGKQANTDESGKRTEEAAGGVTKESPSPREGVKERPIPIGHLEAGDARPIGIGRSIRTHAGRRQPRRRLGWSSSCRPCCGFPCKLHLLASQALQCGLDALAFGLPVGQAL